MCLRQFYKYIRCYAAPLLHLVAVEFAGFAYLSADRDIVGVSLPILLPVEFDVGVLDRRENLAISEQIFHDVPRLGDLARVLANDGSQLDRGPLVRFFSFCFSHDKSPFRKLK